jgi:hypothetical protein
MPQCLFIISWDTLEGAIVTSKFPADVEINVNNVQTIDVAHAFHKDSPWIIVEDKDFKAVSYYNEVLLKSVALLLTPNEVPSNFVKFLEQLAEFVLPVQDEEAVTHRLQEAFSLVQAEIPVTEVVLLNFANEIQQLKEQLLDVKIQVRSIMDVSSDLPTKLLLYLLVNESSTAEKIAIDFSTNGYEKAQVMIAMAGLLDKHQVMFLQKEQKYKLNPLIKPAE